MRWSLGAVILVAVAAVPATAEAAPEVRLSDEWTFTRSAEVHRVAAIRRAPEPGARVVGRLRELTEDRYPEVYLLLRERDGWTQVRIPAGQTAAAAGCHHPRSRRRASRIGRWRSTAAGCGRGRPTPAAWCGRRRWASAPKARRRRPGASGSARSCVFAATRSTARGRSAPAPTPSSPTGRAAGRGHPRHRPAGLIPGRPSHGGVRLRNVAIRYLARHLPVGAPVRIR